MKSGQRILAALTVLLLLSPWSGVHADTINICYYFIGSSLETDSGAASEDIKEILRAETSPEVNIYLFAGGAKSWRIFPEVGSGCVWMTVRDNRLVRLEELGPSSVCSSAMLTACLRSSAALTPAARTAVVFWGHGFDDPPAVGFDSESGDLLTLEEIREGISDAGVHVDLIGFDACSMATEENARLLADAADYLVAAAGPEDLNGWSHSRWLSRLPAESAEEVAALMADAINTLPGRKGLKKDAVVISLSEYRK